MLSPLSDAWFHNDALFIIDVWVWTALAFALWLSRRREAAGERWQRPTQVALAAVVAYISLNAGVGALARRDLADRGLTDGADAVFAGLQPFLFWKRDLIWRVNGRIGRAAYDPVSGIQKVEPALPDRMDDPLVRRARRANPDVIDFLRWSVLPIASVSQTACRARVSFGDARFGQPRVSARFVQSVDLPVAGPGCPPLLASAR